MKRSAFTTHSVTHFHYEYGNDRVPFSASLWVRAIQGPNGVFLKQILDLDTDKRPDVLVVKFIGPVEILAEWVTQLADFDYESASALLDCIWSRKAQADQEPGEFLLAGSERPNLNVGSHV